MRDIDRRRFLRDAFLLAAAGQLPLRRATAQTPPSLPHTLVVVFLEGGWDVHLFGDPRVNPRMVRYTADQVLPFAGQQLGVGPLMTSFVERFADDLTIIRGVKVGIDGHAFAMHSTFYGETLLQLNPADRDSLQAQWVRTRTDAANTILPNISLTNAGINNPKVSAPGAATPIFTGPDALEALFSAQGGVTLTPAARALIQAQVSAKMSPRRRSLYERAAAVLGSDSGSRVSLDPALALVPGRGRTDLNEFDRQCLMAYQLIANGLSSCITIGIGNNYFDTHQASGYGTHLAAGRTIFGDRTRFDGLSGLAMLLDLLKRTRGPDGRPHIDHTTIVVASEFGRAALQSLHNEDNNNYMLIGKGIASQRGGLIFGASTDVRDVAQAVAVDLATGRPSPGGDILNPGHLFDTVLAAGGANAPRAIRALLA